MTAASISPEVSIIITTYNRSNLLVDSINSVLSQTYSNYELLIVDDASTDATPDLVMSYKSNKIHYIRHESNQGLAAARNTGLYNAHGEFIAYLDDDDLWKPSKLERQITLWRSHSNRQHCVIYCAPVFSLENGEILTDNIPTARGTMIDSIYRGYLIPQSCLLLLRKDLLAIGGHSEELISCIDHDLWMKLAQAGFQMDFVPERLVIPNPNEHDLLRMTKQLDKRLTGIEQFYTKWQKTVTDAKGEKAWQSIEDIYYFRTLYEIKEQLLTHNISKSIAITYLRKLIQLQSSKTVPLLDYLLIILHLYQIVPIKKMIARVPGYPVRLVKRWSK